MTTKQRESPVQQRQPKEKERAPVVVEVIPDVFTDLWVRYADGSWRWIDLTFLAETEAFRPLRNPNVFRQARISRNKLNVEWPGSLRLSIKHLAGSPNELNDQHIFVRAASDTAFGWYRPLVMTVPKWVERNNLPREVREAKFSEADVLEWLGFSKAQLERVANAYTGKEEVIMARLFDLAMYLTEPTRAGVATLKRWLTQPWEISNHLTPEEAIEHGQIAYVERLFTGKTELSQNFTTGRRENFTGGKM